ncbi:MAG TPA: hemerythrin domain-containing protein [Chondromyces sp.]|nr:hemerythrin domain-containing protein [Chondromyces sp.]
MNTSIIGRKPIKRSEHFIALSREHHFGLLFCWKIRQGLNRSIDPDRIHKYVQYFWEGHLKQHFLEEESLLFSKANENLYNQGIKEHNSIRSLIIEMNKQDRCSISLLQQLADLLDQHIRFEERILFPSLETQLSDEELKTIGSELHAHHLNVFKDDYEDEFWIYKK